MPTLGSGTEVQVGSTYGLVTQRGAIDKPETSAIYVASHLVCYCGVILSCFCPHPTSLNTRSDGEGRDSLAPSRNGTVQGLDPGFGAGTAARLSSQRAGRRLL